MQPDVLTEAEAVIATATERADPEADLRALERRAAPEDRPRFTLLREALVHALAPAGRLSPQVDPRKPPPGPG
jgi:hypothetical protein